MKSHCLPATALALTGLVLLAGCGGGGGGSAQAGPSSRSTPAELLALKRFSAGCQDFLAYAADGLTDEYLRQFVCLFDAPCPVFIAGPEPAPAPGAPGEAVDSGGRPDRVSGTNVQEAGVDEADIVKADADGRLYILSGSTLSLIEAFPPERLSTREPVVLDLSAGDPGFFAEDLFLDEARKRVVVLGNRFDEGRGAAVSVLIDVADPAAPRETARIGVDGFGLEARRIGARVHRVSRFEVPRPDWFFAPQDSLRERREAYLAARDAGREAEAERIESEVRAEIARRVDSAGSAALLPRSFSQSPGGAPTESLLDCGAISRPDVSTGLGLALIDSFDLDGNARATSGVINNAHIVYASARNLYLAQSSAGWFFAPDQLEETVVYRLALSESGAAAYQALGKLPGSVRDSFSFSEHEAHLRVASTESRFDTGRDASVNGLHILDAAAAGEMRTVSSIENLAPGERIQGVRLLGDRGFVVTFRQIDPLFAFDLSDPRRPRLASELKIPGFSSYLSPIGDDYLLTVGREGTEQELTGAVAIQLFDVRDLDKVRRVASLAPAVGGASFSYSVAENDPHAFNYFPDAANAAAPGTLTLPLSVFDESSRDNAFTGFLVVRVAPDSAAPLAEIGRIDHAQFLADRDFCGRGATDFCAPAYFAAEPRRAVYAQSGPDIVLYTISAVGVRAHDARQPGLAFGGRALPYDPPCCFIDFGGGVARPAPPGGSSL